MNRKPFLAALVELLAAYRPHLNLARPHWLHGWLPSRGNVIFTLLMFALLVLAQSAGALPLPSTLSAPCSTPSTGAIAYQGRLADADGNPLTSTINMSFRLYDAASGGTPLWEEQWAGSNGVQVSDGLFNVMLGSLTQIPIYQLPIPLPRHHRGHGRRNDPARPVGQRAVCDAGADGAGWECDDG